MIKKNRKCIVLLASIILGGSLYTDYSPRIQTQAATTNQSKVLKRMRDMANLRWRPQKDLKVSTLGYWDKVEKKMVVTSTTTYYSSNIYYGMPYSQVHNDSLEAFWTYANTGRSPNADLYIYKGASAGNDCSTAVALAWKQCFSGMKYQEIDTSDFLSCAKTGKSDYYHMKTVQGYKIGSQNTTKDYCATKGKDTIIKLYKGMQTGDSLFHRKTDNGHALLVASIDNKKETVVCVEQRTYTSSGSWRTKTYTFDDLYKQGYLPVYCTNVR